MTKIDYPDTWLWEVKRNPRCGRAQNRGRSQFNRVGVLHATDGQHDDILSSNGARATAAYQNNLKRTGLIYSGYHFLVDKGGVVGQCNPRTTRAFHAGRSWNWNGIPGGGNNHIGLSLFSQAHLWPYQDTDKHKVAAANILDNAAQVMAMIYDRFGIPLVRISIDEYRGGKQGWLGHMDVANRPVGRKPDPGEHFPWDDLIKLAKAHSKPVQVPDKKIEAVGRPTANLTGLTIEEAGFLHELVAELKKAGARPSSLRHVLAFYRRLATKSNKGGEYPVDVADWLTEKK